MQSHLIIFEETIISTTCLKNAIIRKTQYLKCADTRIKKDSGKRRIPGRTPGNGNLLGKNSGK